MRSIAEEIMLLFFIGKRTATSLRMTLKMMGAVVQKARHCGFLIICFAAALGANEALRHYTGRPQCWQSLALGHLCLVCNIILIILAALLPTSRTRDIMRQWSPVTISCVSPKIQ